MSFTKSILSVGACAIVLYTGSAFAQSKRGTASRAATLSAPDRKFVEDAARDGYQEVEITKMAVDRATNPAVKEYAQTLLDDHTKANEELATLAKDKGIALPSRYANSANYTKLSKMSGAEFDREFVSMQIADHQKDISAFDREAMHGSDQDVKNWANKMLPTLRAHLEKAKTLNP